MYVRLVRQFASHLTELIQNGAANFDPTKKHWNAKTNKKYLWIRQTPTIRRMKFHLFIFYSVDRARRARASKLKSWDVNSEQHRSTIISLVIVVDSPCFSAYCLHQWPGHGHTTYTAPTKTENWSNSLAAAWCGGLWLLFHFFIWIKFSAHIAHAAAKEFRRSFVLVLKTQRRDSIEHCGAQKIDFLLYAATVRPQTNTFILQFSPISFSLFPNTSGRQSEMLTKGSSIVCM